MVKVVLASVSVLLGAAACTSSAPPPLPPVWSANYAVPFAAMVSCLAAKPAGAFAVSPPDLPQDGVAVISFTPTNTPQAGSTYTVRQSGSSSQVIWRRPGNVGGPTECNLLAVWAQNASAGGIRKHQLGPLRRALSRYKGFLGERPAVVAGDLNSNTIWDKPGWRINHSTKVRILEESFGLVSAYHAVRGEAHGAESEPTLYWRDRTKDGPTYHIDYIFVPSLWIGKVRELSIGTFETWCGSGLSDHVPVVVDVDV